MTQTRRNKTALAFLLFALTNGASADVLKVNLADSIRPVTHCASGSLYGMTEQLPVDIQGLVAPLKPHMFCQPPEGTRKNQHDFGDGFIVAERLKGTTAQVQITLPDLLPYWPYQWPGQQSWLSSVEKYVKKKHDSGLDNIHSYVIWNEPDGTWKNENGSLYTTVWKPTYELLRKLDPDTKIVGPCIAYYHGQRMKDFLTFCKENNCLPDEICWHQWGSEGLAGAVEEVRKLEKELGIPDLPICINEYCAGSGDDKKKFEGCPGYSVPFIAKFERYGVESATISWWFTGLPGRLGSLLTDKNEKGGGWWLYKWYGDMEGYMAKVTPPKDKSDGLDGFAAVDKKQHCASVVIGGNMKGEANVVIEKLPDFLNGSVKVKIERVTWQSKDTPVKSTDLVSETIMPVTNSGLTVNVNVESPYYAYRVYLTPTEVKQTPYKNTAATVPGTIEAENYDEAGQGFSYYDNDMENKGKLYREDGVDVVEAGSGYAVGYTEKGEWMEYTIEVEEDNDYVVTANVSNSNELDGFQLFVDDEAVTDAYTIPQTCNDWSVYEEVPVSTTHISKGKHILKLVIEGSYVNIDWLKFTPKSTSTTNINNFEKIVSLKDATYYDMKGKQYQKDELRNNVIYIAITADKKDIFKFVKK